MAEEEDLGFGKLAIEKGYCSRQQWDDAVHTLQEVNKLGLDEKIGNILVKKKFMTESQIKEILKLQGQKSKIKIAGYEIIEKVGQGGMGAVFKARQISLDRVVALKILAPKLAADVTFCERFIKEARAVAKLSHPNIIVGIDVGRHDKYFYFAMEYVEGETALRLLRDNGPFPEEKALRIALEIAKALDHAHKYNFVHRDIKPDNIMVTPRGEAKLCDLGLAKMTEGDPSQSKSNVAVGTPHYIAPEQARGESGVGITADIYALGATLYHLTTGATLFTGNTSRDIMAQHLTEEARSPRKLRPELSEPFCRLLEKMLAKKPADRHANPAELIADIERVLERKPIGEVLAAGAKTSVERVAKAGRGITTGPRAPIDRATTGPRSPVDRPEASQHSRGQAAAGKPMLLVGIAAVLILGIGVGVALSSGGEKPPAKVAKPDPVPPATVKTGEAQVTKVAAKQDPPVEQPEPPAAPAMPPPPLEKSGFEPLDKARQARRERPSDFPAILALYGEAEKGAPHTMVPEIRRERGDVEKAQFQSFMVYFNNRNKDAQRRFEQKSYSIALGMFDANDFPVAVMTDATRNELNKARADLEKRIWDAFNATDRAELDNRFKAAGADVQKFEELKNYVNELLAFYPPKQVQDHLKGVQQRVDQQIKNVTGVADRVAEQAYQAAIDQAMRSGREDNHAQALKVVEDAQGNKPLMAKYGPQMQAFRGDLQALNALFKKAGDVLEAKAGGNETVELSASGDKFAGTVVGKGSDKYGPGVNIKDAAGQNRFVAFARLSSSDVFKLAQVKSDSPEGRYAAGSFHFWKGEMNRSFEQLKHLKGQKGWERAGTYLQLMENWAQQMIDSVHHTGRELADPKLPPDKVSEKRKRLAWLVDRLNREYLQTEAYRARTKR